MHHIFFWIPLCSSFAIAAVLSLIFVSAGNAQSIWKPNKPVEIVVYTAPGGGNDKTARLIHKIWQDTKLADAFVSNKVGGGGAVAYTYTSQKVGDASVIAIAQASLLTNQISGRSPLHYTDVTPLVTLGSEPVVIAVRAESPYKTLKDFMTQLRKEPGSLSVAVGSTRGAINHFAIALLAKAAGTDPKLLKIVVFGGGSESVTNVLGGHVDAMSAAISNAAPHYQAGKMRILGVSSSTRLTAMPDVPTFREQGYDVDITGWYILIGPKGLTQPQVAYWENVLQKTLQQDEWKKYGEANSWSPGGYRNAQDTLAHLRNEYEQSKALLTELGGIATK